MLATETQDCSAGDIGMVQIAGNQSTKIACVLSRSTAATLMRKELHSIDVFEQPMRRLVTVFAGLPVAFDRVDSPFAIQTRKLSNLLPIDLRLSIAQPFF